MALYIYIYIYIYILYPDAGFAGFAGSRAGFPSMPAPDAGFRCRLSTEKPATVAGFSCRLPMPAPLMPAFAGFPDAGFPDAGLGAGFPDAGFSVTFDAGFQPASAGFRPEPWAPQGLRSRRAPWALLSILALLGTSRVAQARRRS